MCNEAGVVCGPAPVNAFPACCCALLTSAVLCGCSTRLGGRDAAPALTSVVPSSATITKVVDGDTFHVAVPGGSDVVRVLGFDSPETKDPRKPIQCWGPQASTYAAQALAGQHVTLVADPTQSDRDRYHRLLRYVHLTNGDDYSLTAITAGMGRVYTYEHGPVQEYPQLEQVQRVAAAAHRGLWGGCPNPPPGD